jgi:AraC-like DNA-binding protein
MREPGTTAMVLLRGLVQAAAQVGVDRTSFCAALGVALADLEGDGAVPTLVVARAWHLAPEMSGDPCFGLHAGSKAELGSYDILDYLFATSSTLGEACLAMERYHRLLAEIWRVELVVEGTTARFRLRVPRDYVEPLAHAWDYFFAGALRRMRSAVPTPISPRMVHLMRARPADPDEYVRVFGCPVEFSHPVGEFVFDAAHLELPLVSSNRALHRLVRRHAEQLLSRLPAEGDLLEQSRSVLAELLPDGPPGVALLARRLGVSERTLQRKLGERGLSYKQLLDLVREEVAVRVLEAGVVTVSDLAFRLGFQSVAAFSRAFHRWRGVSPSEFRKSTTAA